MATGNAAFHSTDWGGAIRLYWSLTTDGAIELMQAATLRLNDAIVPFRLKVLTALARSARMDSVVLYLRGNDYANARPILEGIYTDCRHHLRAGQPVFTKKLAEGLSLAEQPSSGLSFGMERCSVLADGLVRNYERRDRGLRARVRRIEERFEEAGLNLERPYLSPGSTDRYDFSPQRRGSPSLIHAMRTAAPIQTERFLEASTAIGLRLCRDALWHEERCNWLGTVGPHNSVQEGTYAALGGDLYAGSSGVAWYLAELFRVTADRSFGKTAAGAIRHALSAANAISLQARRGLYSGWPGIALMAIRVGQLIKDESVTRAARALLDRAIELEHHDDDFDLISGTAGMIVGLLCAADVLDESSYVANAATLGDRLLRTVERYTSIAPIHLHNGMGRLTGFSHGAAGLGYALTELFDVTRDAAFRAAARQAFAYERRWFSPADRNWPDLRYVRARRPVSGTSLPFAVYWCHGAPGIAISRLRAAKVLDDESCTSEACIALQTTWRSTEAMMARPGANYSLCHGVFGNAEVVQLGSHLLPDEWPDGFARAAAIASDAIVRQGTAIDDWPCAVNGSTPGLMLGLAGIGLFLLRLYRPSIPAATMPRSVKESTHARNCNSVSNPGTHHTKVAGVR
jgi:hypothetical protein